MTPEAATFMPFVPRTKLRPPRLSQDLLRRPRLIEKLQRPQTLSLVIAPAGYGKTTLVSTWLAQSSVPYAWLSLEREDDTLPGFLAGFAAALRRLVPALDGELEKLLQTPSGEPNGEQILQQILPILLNALNGLEERFVVVLDDYHHVHDATIHQLICRLLEHPPQALQLVLTSRYDPPLPPRLRYRGSVTEIRARELGFSEQEAQAFLGQFVAEPIAAQAAAGLVRKSEGWAVPLRLAAMLISQRQDAAALEKALQICERSLLDYLDAEVIGHLPGAVQTFLVRTSILSRLNASLCDAVLGTELGEDQHGIDSKAALRMLVDNGVFVEQLDEAGEWLHYQELFRSLLERRIRNTHSAEEIDAFTRRARVWQEQHDQGEPVVTAQCYVPVCTDMIAALPPAQDGFDALWMAAQAAAESRAPQRVKSQPTARQQARVLLTYREMDVLSLLCERLTNKEIAYKLGVSPETVRQHTVNLYRKLGVAGRRQAIVRAQTLGLMAPPGGSVPIAPQTTNASRRGAIG